MDQNQPKFSGLAVGSIIAISLCADAASILLDFIYLGWIVPLIFNGMVFPFWFWYVGVKYNKNDIICALAGFGLSFVPFLNSVMLEVTVTQLRKIVAVNGKEWVLKATGKTANSKLLRATLKVVKVVAPEATPVIRGVEKGLNVAREVTNELDPSRTQKRGQAYGERTPSRLGATMVGDRTLKNAQNYRASIQKTLGGKVRVGQEIKVGTTLANAAKSLT